MCLAQHLLEAPAVVAAGQQQSLTKPYVVNKVVPLCVLAVCAPSLLPPSLLQAYLSEGDPHLVVSGSDDSFVRVWDTRDRSGTIRQPQGVLVGEFWQPLPPTSSAQAHLFSGQVSATVLPALPLPRLRLSSAQRPCAHVELL